MPMLDLPPTSDLDLGLALYYNGLFVPKGTRMESSKSFHDTVKRAVETQTIKDLAYRRNRPLLGEQ